MNEITEYPQTAPVKRNRRTLKVTLWSAGALVVVAALVVAGVTYGPPLEASVALSNYNTAQAKLQAAVPPAPAGQATTADEQTTLAQSDAAGAKAVTDEQAAEAAALAAAQAAQAAAQAAYAAAHAPHSNRDSSGHIVCPAGTTVDAADASGDAILCFPDICFHLSLPDPAHPECVTAFKP